jgi:hypothetical protein
MPLLSSCTEPSDATLHSPACSLLTFPQVLHYLLPMLSQHTDGRQQVACTTSTDTDAKNQLRCRVVVLVLTRTMCPQLMQHG